MAKNHNNDNNNNENDNNENEVYYCEFARAVADFFCCCWAMKQKPQGALNINLGSHKTAIKKKVFYTCITF